MAPAAQQVGSSVLPHKEDDVRVLGGDGGTGDKNPVGAAAERGLKALTEPTTPASKTEPKNLIACIIDPFVALWNDTIWPGLQSVYNFAAEWFGKIGNWAVEAKNYVMSFFTSPTPSLNPTAEGAESAVNFGESEAGRFADIEKINKAGVSNVLRDRTMGKAEGKSLKAMVVWDAANVGGGHAFENEEALEAMLKDLDVPNAYISFTALNKSHGEQMVTDILQQAYNANDEDDAPKVAVFIENMKKDETYFGEHLRDLREGLTRYFHTKAEALVPHESRTGWFK